MIKTPEELADEYVLSQHDVNVEYSGTLEGCKDDFLAGYKAASPQWISVKDRLPKFNEHNYSDDVLMLGKFGMEITHIEKTKRIVRWKGLQEVVETNNGSSIDEYTHWMPLPNPPEE